MNSPEELLEKNGFYAAAIHGVSMYPMLINHKDTVYIVPAKEPKKHDVLLYRRMGNRQLVLHRCIKAANGSYLMCGDNEFVTETITGEQIIGIMTEFTHRGKRRTLNSLGYKIYVFLWTTPKPIKKAVIFARKLPRRILNKMKRIVEKHRHEAKNKQ